MSMLLSLRERDADARELMDDPGCDPDRLARTLELFRLINPVVSGTRSTYLRWIRPRLRPGRRLRVLDVGTGSADVPRRLLEWAAEDRGELSVVAIDPDPRAIDAAARHGDDDPRLELRCATTRDVVESGETFDVVMSNHVLHHLTPHELGALLVDSEQLLTYRGLAIHNDIERSAAAYLAFAAATLPLSATVLRGSFIRPDGLTSIRRSFTVDELRTALPAPWRAHRSGPFRLTVKTGTP